MAGAPSSAFICRVSTSVTLPSPAPAPNPTPDTDQYQTLLQSVQAGDYVLIGFGHNDERTELGRYSNPTGSVSSSGSFQYNLYEKYIKPVKSKQANPILVTPIVRRNAASNYTGEDGHITNTQKRMRKAPSRAAITPRPSVSWVLERVFRFWT